MKRINEYPTLSLLEEDIADQVVENDPAFRERIEEAFREYYTTGGTTVESLMNKLQQPRRQK